MLDDERLKNPPGPGVAGLLRRAARAHPGHPRERAADVPAGHARSSRWRPTTSPSEPRRSAFFQIIQNKLHFAATGKTAAELIAAARRPRQPNMGLTTWKGGVVRKSDVTVAKNYLKEEEIAELNRIVVMLLDFAEDQARRRKQIFLRTGRRGWTTSCASTSGACCPMPGRSARRSRRAGRGRIRAVRRAPPRLREAEGEQENFKLLEDAAKARPPKKKRPPRKSDHSE